MELKIRRKLVVERLMRPILQWIDKVSEDDGTETGLVFSFVLLLSLKTLKTHVYFIRLFFYLPIRLPVYSSPSASFKKK